MDQYAVVTNGLVSNIILSDTQPTIPGSTVIKSSVGQIGDTWDGSAFHRPVPTYTPEQQAQRLAANQEALWQAAHAYEQSYISGVGLSILALGVLQGKSKALQVSAWSQALWTEYYARKATVTADSPASGDFSTVGPMPYSVPELAAESGV